MGKKSRKDWMPNTPAAELISYWARGPGSEPLHKPAAELCYTYTQDQLTLLGALFNRKVRRARYVVRVVEDHAGRRTARTERYDPERGSASRTGHSISKRVELQPLTPGIYVPMLVFTVALSIVLLLALPFPVNIVMALLWALWLSFRMAFTVRRARMAKHLRRLPEDLPPLLSPEELDTRLLELASPDEDRTFDVPAPIPMAQALRDPAWQRWADRLEELPDQEYKVGKSAYVVKRNNGFSDGPNHPLYRLVCDIRNGMLRDYPEQIDYVVADNGMHYPIVSTAEREMVLRPLFEVLGREVLGPERVAQLDDRRRAAAHGEPMLDRPFAARADCAEGHVGEHPILSTFTDSLSRKRVRRGCLWCPSTWSELV